jgi:hypothetical protein
MHARRECVQDVPAVELARRYEVERGDQKAEPACDQDRMPEQRTASVHAEEVCEDGPQEQQQGRFVEGNEPDGCSLDGKAEGEAERSGGGCDEKAGDGAAGGNHQKRSARAYGGAEPDDGAHRSGQGRRGKNERQRCVDVEGAGREVVAELVREQDGQQCDGKRQTVGKRCAMRPRPGERKDIGRGREWRQAGAEVGHVQHADRSGCDAGANEQKGLQHEHPGACRGDVFSIDLHGGGDWGESCHGVGRNALS